MLQDILITVKETLQKSAILNEYQIDQLIKNAKWWENGDRVYPGTIMAKINSDVNTTYDILDIIKQIGILEVNYEIYCSKCDRFKGKVYSALNQIPKELTCDCNHIIEPFNDTIVIYRVVNDGTIK